MRRNGVLKTWNDERGFGFIEPSYGGLNIFVHIKDFPPGAGRPVVGQLLLFAVETDANGRRRATQVQYLSRALQSTVPKTKPATSSPRLHILAIPLFALIYGLVVSRWGSWSAVPVAYLILSLVTFFAYAQDKSAATSGRRRTPEQTLHFLSLLGGWPGALVAQQWLRHKTRKAGFVPMFWLTVLLNVGVLVAWHAGVLPFPTPKVLSYTV